MSETSYYDMKARGRAKFERKIQKKRSQNKAVHEALAEEPNDSFITDYFRENHLVMGEPDGDRAIQKAVQRGVPTSTSMFLADDEFQVLADDIREFHRRAMNQGAGFNLFTTDKSYAYIDVTTNNNPPPARLASAVQYGRIQFSMKHVGDVDLGGGQSVPIHAIYHLQEMFLTGVDEARAGAFHEDEPPSGDESEEDFDETDT